MLIEFYKDICMLTCLCMNNSLLCGWALDRWSDLTKIESRFPKDGRDAKVNEGSTSADASTSTGIQFNFTALFIIVII